MPSHLAWAVPPQERPLAPRGERQVALLALAVVRLSAAGWVCSVTTSEGDAMEYRITIDRASPIAHIHALAA